MRKFCLLFLFLTNSVFAETVSLKFDSIPLIDFVQATYGTMLKRDYILSPEVLSISKPISIHVKTIDSLDLPAFIENLLQREGIYSQKNDKGIYYLSVKRDLPVQVTEHGLPLNVVPGQNNNNNNNIESSSYYSDLEQVVYEPVNRKADFLAMVLNAVYSSKAATLAGRNIVLSASPEILKKMLVLVKSVDMLPNKVKVSATFVEVSTTATSNTGVSVLANLLGAKLGIKLGDTANASLTLGGRNFQLVLDAISADSRFKQVSNPTVVVDDYEKTNVTFGDSVPTVSGSTVDRNGNAIQQVQYQSSGVILDVTPRVLGSGQINLTVDGQVSSFSTTTSGVNSSPTLTKRQIQTVLTIADGDILVMGGLNANKAADSASGFSFLPKFLSAKSDNSQTSDLVLILSASVIR